MAHRRVHITQTQPWFVVTGPYQPDVVRAMRAIPGRSYEPATQTWRVPKTVEPLRALLIFAAAYDPRSVTGVLHALRAAIHTAAASSARRARPPWWGETGLEDDETPALG